MSQDILANIFYKEAASVSWRRISAERTQVALNRTHFDLIARKPVLTERK